MVDADEEVTELWKKELDLFVGELPKFGAQDILDTDMAVVASGMKSRQLSCVPVAQESTAYARYATAREGSLLK